MKFFVFSLVGGALLLIIARFVGKDIDYKFKLQMILSSFVVALIAFLAGQIYPLWVVGTMILLLGLSLAYYLSLQFYRNETSEEMADIMLAAKDRRGESPEQVPFQRVEEHKPTPAAYFEEKESPFIAEQLNETFDQAAASVVMGIETNPIMEFHGVDNDRDGLIEEEVELQFRDEETTLEEEWPDLHIEKERKALFEELERDWGPPSIQTVEEELPLNEKLAIESDIMHHKEPGSRVARDK